jgi:hypothetical protein
MKTLIILIATVSAVLAQWPQAKSPTIPEADGYVEIPNVALPPTKDSKYQAIFDATRPANKATQLVPALNMAGSELNALGAANAPLANPNSLLYFMAPPSTAFWTTLTTRRSSAPIIQI